MTEPVYVFEIEDGVPRVAMEYPSEQEAANDFPGAGEAKRLLLEAPPGALEDSVLAFASEKAELMEAENAVLQDEVHALEQEVSFLRVLLGDKDEA